MIAYKGTGKVRTAQDVIDAAKGIGILPAALHAIMEVEAGSQGFYADGRLVMLPEPHVLFRELATQPAVQSRAVAAGVAYRVWKTKPYPAKVDDRYALFNRMTEVAGAEMAARSCSWGLPQMMGFNHLVCGYKDAVAMVEDFALGERQQVFAMCQFIARQPALLAAVRAGRWGPVARIYNGPKYRDNRYDERLAVAFAKHNKGHSDPNRLLLFRSKGEDVAQLQRDLNRVGGYGLGVDGDFGAMTRQAVEHFQRKNGLTPDGKYGDKSRAAMAVALGKVK